MFKQDQGKNELLISNNISFDLKMSSEFCSVFVQCSSLHLRAQSRPGESCKLEKYLLRKKILAHLAFLLKEYR